MSLLDDTVVPRTDFTGRRFGRLVVRSFLGRRRERSYVNPHRESWWRCECDCGRMHDVRTCSLRSGGTKSCGCLLTKHGRFRNYESPPEYVAWLRIRRIASASVCERWSSFDAFLRDMGEKPRGDFVLARREWAKGYTPENCYWETRHAFSRVMGAVRKPRVVTCERAA